MEIEITDGALQNLAALPKREAAQVLNKIARLRNGLVGDIKRLHEADYGFRLRAGRYRVLFDLDGDTIVIQKIGDRKDVYD